MTSPPDPRVPGDQPTVSIIIPSYNGERTIAEATGSILAQTWRDLELIVIDDGSTDGTRAILREVAARDGRMRVIEKANEGLIATLNRGIAEARGRYIARLDHDDVARPNRLERQLSFLEAHPDYVAVGCLTQNMLADGTFAGKTRIRYEKLQHRPGAFPPRQQWLYGPTPMMRADALRRTGGYRPQFVASEDRDLCWRLGALGPMERLPEILVNYRYHASNMSRLKRRTQIYSNVLSDMSAVAAHFGLDDEPIIEAIEVGGNYAPIIDAYRDLLRPHYPIDSFVLFCQLRMEIWDLDGQPDRAGIWRAVLAHVAAKPFDPIRLFLLRRALLYMTRAPRAPGGHRPRGG